MTRFHSDDYVHFLKVQFVACLRKSTRLWFVIVRQNVNREVYKGLFINCCLIDSSLEFSAEPKRLQKQTGSLQHWFWHGLSCIRRVSSFYAQLLCTRAPSLALKNIARSRIAIVSCEYTVTNASNSCLLLLFCASFFWVLQNCWPENKISKRWIDQMLNYWTV